MFRPSNAKRIYIAVGYSDLRRGIDGFASLIQNTFHMNPQTNALFIFCGRKTDRMAWRNGFLYVDDFYSMCVSPYGGSLFAGYGKEFSGDISGVNERLDVFSGNLPEGHLLHDDPKKFYFEHSLYPLYAMFFKSDKEKKEHIDYVCFGKEKASSATMIPVSRSDRPLCFCKECYEQDKEKYGKPLFHLEHQIDGVCVCPVHNTPLWYPERITEEFSCKNMKKLDSYYYTDPFIAYQYAVMCKELLENPIETTAKDIEEAINNTMSDLSPALWSSYTEKEIKEHDFLNKKLNMEQKTFLLHAAQDSGLLDGVNGYKQKAFSRGGDENPEYYIYNNYRVNVNTGLVMLFILYRTANYAREILQKKGHLSAEDKARIAVNLLTDEYTVESIEATSYNTNITLKHNKCGQITSFTIRKFMNGERCPHCQERLCLKDVLSRETDWIVQQRGKNQFAIRNNHIIEMSDKEMLQEINRPFLSPIIRLTEEDRRKAHAKYRADEIIRNDDAGIIKALNDIEVNMIFRRLNEMYSDEAYDTVKALSDHYSRCFSGWRFSFSREVI